MRLLNRLNQYQRLWQPSAGEPVQATVAELAGRCFCSERHVRTLLNQLEEAGWLRWRAQSGRGKRGELTFLVTPDSVRSGMMEEVLHKGQHQNALALAKIAPEQLRHLLQPFLGGQWQNNTPTLRIPYYRPLETLQPGFLPGRAEQHLAGHVFSGLTRFITDSTLPQPDLAHHWQVSDDGLSWHFFIRSTLHWHNGEAVETVQLQQRLLMLLTLPSMRRLFVSVKAIDLPHSQCLRFVLHRPDYWLPFRLASYCSRLAHPQNAQLGCELTLIFHDAKNWSGCEPLAEADLVMGDRLIGEAPEYTLEQWLRSDVFWTHIFTPGQYTHMQTTLDAVQIHPDDTARYASLRQVFSALMQDAIITPLFNYRYQISAPPGVNGIELNAWGWFDFTRAWLPPPSMA